MLVEKDQIGPMIKQVKLFDENKFDTVMYLKDQINQPTDLHFTDSAYEASLFRATAPDADSYSSIRTGGLLEVLEGIEKKQSIMPELPFTDKNSKIYDLTNAIENQRQVERVNLIGQTLGWGNINPEVQPEKNNMKHSRH